MIANPVEIRRLRKLLKNVTYAKAAQTFIVSALIGRHIDGLNDLTHEEYIGKIEPLAFEDAANDDYRVKPTFKFQLIIHFNEWRETQQGQQRLPGF